MNNIKQKQVYEILLLPIECDKNKYDGVYRKGNKIYTGQHYISSISDEDMSDFAIGYYEIIYKSILDKKPILLDDGNLFNANFAGDTMNSFNTVANRVPGVGSSREERKTIPKSKWPKYLQEYETNYHCLANFWVIPMEIGRTLEPMSKAKVAKDYMDRFLKVYCADKKLYVEKFNLYFNKIKSFTEFAKIHFLLGSNVDKNMQIVEYSTPIGDGKEFIRKAQDMMKKRAYLISKSKYAEELWDYFNKLGIL